MQRAGAACHHSRKQAEGRKSPEPHRYMHHHAPPTSDHCSHCHPLVAPLHAIPRPAASVPTKPPCRAPSRAALTGTTAHLTTTTTTTTTGTQTDMMTATTTAATAAATNATTTNTPNATTTDTTTATPSQRAARSGIATTLLPPSRMNLTTRAGAHTHQHHPAAPERANQPAAAERRKRKTPNSTTWAKLPSSLA